jgi:phosphopantothenoylcysteine decarboxylase/phosphopantothenate--cysteine ligase
MNVLLGVSGGIAAIKAPEIVRRLREGEHQVRCALTANASAFVSPLSLEVLSGAPVMFEEYLEPGNAGRELHIDMGRWADVLCVAPATCNLLARMSLGLADDFLTTTTLVFAGPVVFAPAMSFEMWAKKVVQDHVSSLERRGFTRVGPVTGPLATGEIGEGRMAEPETIVEAVEAALTPRDLVGKTVLVTAGPTREPIDPVRFLSNRSTGKMGFSLAAAAAARGARTILIAGPVNLATPAGVERLDVETALELEARVNELAGEVDLVVMTAAVADFRPRVPAMRKLKKGDGAPEIDLEPNPDILAGLAEKAPRTLRVGFAAETDDLESEGLRKLQTKRAHFVVANDVSRDDIGFAVDQNEVLVFARDRQPVRLPRQSKSLIAHRLLDIFAEALSQREAGSVASER